MFIGHQSLFVTPRFGFDLAPGFRELCAITAPANTRGRSAYI